MFVLYSYNQWVSYRYRSIQIKINYNVTQKHTSAQIIHDRIKTNIREKSDLGESVEIEYRMGDYYISHSIDIKLSNYSSKLHRVIKA